MEIKMQVTKNFKLSELEFSDAIPPELELFKELWGSNLGGNWCVDPYASKWRELLAQKR